MNTIKDLIKKYGLGFVMGAATFDGYKKQVVSDRKNNILDKNAEERYSLPEGERLLYDNKINEEINKSNNQAAFGRYTESADDHKKYFDRYNSDLSEINKTQMDNAKKKLDSAYAEISKLDITEIFSSLYNKYSEYLDSLTPDKIVCLFNIIIDGLIFSSFVSVLSIMLSENIINKISFLEKYPRILKILKLRNTINKKVSKFYLLMHLIIIILGFLANIVMFFI